MKSLRYLSAGTLAGFVAVAFTVAAPAATAVELKVLEWEGYISPDEKAFEAWAKAQGKDVDLVFVKNIDNVVPEHLAGPTQEWKKALAGVLLLAPGAYTLITKNPVGPLARNTMLILVALSLGSGFWNFFARLQEGVAKGYHMWFGVKFLLALHILSMAVIAAGAGGKGAS